MIATSAEEDAVLSETTGDGESAGGIACAVAVGLGAPVAGTVAETVADLVGKAADDAALLAAAVGVVLLSELEQAAARIVLMDAGITVAVGNVDVAAG